MTVLAAARVVTGEQVHSPGWVAYEADRITGVGHGRPGHVDRDLGDAVVVPGFVDVHVHGGGGGAFTGDVASALQAVETHRRHGTTTTMASLVTADAGELLTSVSMLAELYEAGVIAGIHLEGPWISPSRCGAHDPTQLRHPDRVEMGRLLEAGRGAVRMVTLAPELPGGYDAIRQVVDAGAVAAVGHTDASYEEVVQAISAGARVATHLFNGMRPIHHRRPGPILALLEDPQVSLELIVDGSHLHPALFRRTSEAVGPDRVLLVTDAMAAAAMRDGSYQLGALGVTVSGGVAHVTDTDTIAGSTATTDQLFRAAVEAVLSSSDPDHTPEVDTYNEALLRAALQTSTNPARTFSWTDIGSLQPGLRADLVLLDTQLHVIDVVRCGVSCADTAPSCT